jgi:hypothetical protein
VALAGEVDAGELLVEADPDVGVGLVVAQADVEPRPVALDELLLGEQRLGLVLGDEEVDLGDLGDHLGAPAGRLAGEVPTHALANRARLADVEHLASLVLEHVDTGLIRQLLTLRCNVNRTTARHLLRYASGGVGVVGILRFGHSPTG